MQENPKVIPFIALEAAMFRMERMNKRLLAALCVSLAANVVILAVKKSK